RRRLRIREHRDARFSVGAGDAAGPVEEHLREPDLTVESERRVHVGNADADVVDAAKGGQPATGVCNRPNSTSTSWISSRLRGSSTGRRGRRGSPPGWPSSFMIAFSWLWEPPYFPAQPPGSHSRGKSASVRSACARHASSSPAQ